MTTLYVDNIAPNLQSRVSVPGIILQLIEFSPSGDSVTSSTSFVDSLHTLSITPTSTSSKILITFEAAIRLSGHERARGGVRFNRDGSSLFTGFTEETQAKKLGDGTGSEFNIPNVKTYLDSPNTTSSVTYMVQHAAGSSSVASRIYGTTTGSVSVLRLMEIAG